MSKNIVIDPAVFAARRGELLRRMREGVAIVPTSPEHIRNRDSDYLYRFDSYFYYLTGFPEPEAVLLIIAGSKDARGATTDARSILFCRDKNEEQELWTGFRYGPAATKEKFGVDETYSFSALDAEVVKLLANQPVLHYAPGADKAWDERIMGWLNAVRAQSRAGIVAPTEIRDIRTALDEMRLRKDPSELATMRRAADISAAAHIRAMHATKPGRMEYEIEAELMYEFRRHGAQFPAYWPIVAGGANACILHYRANDEKLTDGDLLLIDAGCELDGYASDVTRTWPVNGKFTTPQREIYELVLASQQSAIDIVKPGVSWDAPHQEALKTLVQGFIDYGLCKGTVSEVIESGDYRRFFMHRTGHWLGLNVHDAGEYKQKGDWRPLEPGMMLTVEPGCYIRPADNVPEKYWNIGVRIEDDALVTATGSEIITHATPKSVKDVEALVGRG